MVSEDPVKAKVTITGTQTRTFDPFPPTHQFNLLRTSFNPQIQGKASRAILEIEDSAAALLNAFTNGNTVKIFLSKTSTFPAQPHFLGRVEQVKRKRVQSKELTYELTALGITNRLFHRVANLLRIQDRQVDGVTPDANDTKTRIDNLVKDLIQEEDAYPTGEPTLEDEGISVAGVDTSTKKIPQYFGEMKPVSDILKELAEIDGKDFWIDTLGVLNFTDPETTNSGVLFTDDPDEVHDETLKGIIVDDEPFTINEIIEGYTVNRLFGLGGDELEKDQFQETVTGGPDALDANFRAIKFTPDKNKLAYIAVNIEKLGNPVVDLQGQVRETFDDDNDADDPNGAIVKAFALGKDKIASGQAWYYIDIGAQFLNTKQNYWLILNKVGDASNTYRWFHDALSINTSAFSANGTTWTVDSTGVGYGFRTLSSNRLLTVASEDDSKDKYGLREDVFSAPAIRERQTMDQLITEEVARLSKQKRIITFTSYAPDNVPQIGQMVQVHQSKTPSTGVNSLMEMIDMSFDLTHKDLGQSVMRFTALDFID